MSWRWGQTTILTQVLLAIAALLPHLVWDCSTVDHWGPKPSVWSWFSLHWHPVSNWFKPSGTRLYYCLMPTCFRCSSTVLLLIYTGASLDWQLGQGSIYNTILKTIQVRWTRYAGHSWRSKDKLVSNILLWPPTLAGQPTLADQQELIYIGSAWTQVVVWKNWPSQ